MDALLSPFSSQLPARHAVESDSDSDFSDPEAGPAPVRPTPPVKKRYVVDGLEEREKGNKCLVALDEAGQLWTRGLKQSLREDGLIRVNHELVGCISTLPGQVTLLCFSTHHLPLSTLNILSKSILTAFEPSSIQVVDAYEPELYLPNSPPDPPCRSLQSSNHPSTNLQPFSIPNMLTGLSASLASQAARSDLPFQATLIPYSTSKAAFYDPSGLAREDEVAVHALGQVDIWDQVQWTAARMREKNSRWEWLARAQKERAASVRNQEDQMYL